ncbi:hypothetical protein F4775DRAFT_420184 [Biscogniauxia sp. FL1348]|nr:hypothetical protein F4775DRAFT_420184 [Biscogniauxia sp. FL1348]
MRSPELPCPQSPRLLSECHHGRAKPVGRLAGRIPFAPCSWSIKQAHTHTHTQTHNMLRDVLHSNGRERKGEKKGGKDDVEDGGDGGNGGHATAHLSDLLCSIICFFPKSPAYLKIFAAVNIDVFHVDSSSVPRQPTVIVLVTPLVAIIRLYRFLSRLMGGSWLLLLHSFHPVEEWSRCCLIHLRCHHCQHRHYYHHYQSHLT